MDSPVPLIEIKWKADARAAVGIIKGMEPVFSIKLFHLEQLALACLNVQIKISKMLAKAPRPCFTALLVDEICHTLSHFFSRELGYSLQMSKSSQTPPVPFRLCLQGGVRYSAAVKYSIIVPPS